MEPAITPTKEQTAALFGEASKGMIPAEPTRQGTAERLAPYRRLLRKYRKLGYSYEQLAQILRSPKIGIEVGVPMLRKCMAASRSRRRRRAVKKTAPATAK